MYIQGRSTIINQLESFNRSKFPACLKTILKCTGYDTAMSLKALNEENISKLEVHMNENRGIVDSFKCCSCKVYKTQAEIKLLPGHKAALLLIPGQITELKSCKPVKTKPRKSSDELVQKLIVLLNSHVKEISQSENVISDNNIKDIVGDGVSGIRCIFSCPFCVKRIPVIYSNQWWSSNATKHIKNHVEAHVNRNTHATSQ